MKKMIFPIILALSPLTATGAYCKTDSTAAKSKTSFLEQIQEESKETIYYENEEYTITERNNKTTIYPNPGNDFSKKAVIFTYLMKKSMNEMLGNGEDLNRELRLTIKELAEESYDFYKWTGLELFEESKLARLAGMSTPYEDQLEKEIVGNANNIFQTVKNGGLSWETALYGYFDLATPLKDLEREGLENEISKERKLKSLDEQAKASIEYLVQNGIETIADDFSEYMLADTLGYPKNMLEIARNTIKDDAMNCVGFVDPRAISVMRALSPVMFVDKFLKKEKIDLSNFSYEDAKKIYFAPLLHKLYIFEVYAYSKIFHSIRESSLKGEVGNFRGGISSLGIEEILLINDEPLNQLFYKGNLDKGWKRWGIEKDMYIKKVAEFLEKKGMTGLIPYSFVEEVNWSLLGYTGAEIGHYYSYGWWFGFVHDYYKDKYNEIEFTPMENMRLKNNYFRLNQRELEEKIQDICNGLK